MGEKRVGMGDIDIAWCPGCGNFKILAAGQQTLETIGLAVKEELARA